MPPRPARSCGYPGCAVLVRDGTSRCAKHPRRPWTRTSAPKRITGRKLQRLRKTLFEASPLCVICLAAGRVRESTIRDHVLALTLGGSDVEDNVQALCKRCNDEKRVAEAAAARRGEGEKSI